MLKCIPKIKHIDSNNIADELFIEIFLVFSSSFLSLILSNISVTLNRNSENNILGK